MTREEAEALIKTTPEYVPGPCPWCGAKTVDEAGEKCRPTQMPCGDYTCGTPEDGPETDGLLHQFNPEYQRLSGYLWGWYAVDAGLTDQPPTWDEPESN